VSQTNQWVGDHPKEDLAKFGYRPERKVDKFRNGANILVTC
jgi:hypothetical protein